MRIPKKLKIRRAVWDVKFSESIRKTDQAIGLCLRSTKEIFIAPDMARNDIEETFIHELLHASWPANTCSHRLEESIIRKLSPVLYKALIENKLLVKGEHEPIDVTPREPEHTEQPSKYKRRRKSRRQR